MRDFDRRVLEVCAERAAPHGTEVWEALERSTGHFISLAGVYTALERLEKQGLVTSWKGASTPERGGRPKCHFAVTDTGQLALTHDERNATVTERNDDGSLLFLAIAVIVCGFITFAMFDWIVTDVLAWFAIVLGVLMAAVELEKRLNR